MRNDFKDFLEDLAQGTDARSLWTALSKASGRLGFSRLAYVEFPKPSTAQQPLLLSSYPEAWQQCYTDNRYYTIDPVIAETAGSILPFEWGDADYRKGLSPDRKALFEEAAEFGIRIGFTVPVRGTQGQVAGLTYASADRDASFRRCIRQHGHLLHVMAIHFHAHVQLKAQTTAWTQSYRLSPRERECLLWSAQGKTRWEIAQILSITPRTVTFHLENAKRKIGVFSICKAVAIAIEDRVIHP